MALNRREMLRWGVVGGGGALLSAAVSANPADALRFRALPGAPAPLPAAPATVAAVPAAPAGIDPALFARARAALDLHRTTIRHHDRIGVVDFSMASAEPRFHLVDLLGGRVESFAVAHGRGSDPGHSGFLDHFSNRMGSCATSNGAYRTAETYHGKYGLSMRVDGLDWSNNMARERDIVIHNAWYAEPEMIAQHGKLGRSEGCFAFSRRDQWAVMDRIGGGRMIYADKLA